MVDLRGPSRARNIAQSDSAFPKQAPVFGRAPDAWQNAADSDNRDGLAIPRPQLRYRLLRQKDLRAFSRRRLLDDHMVVQSANPERVDSRKSGRGSPRPGAGRR